MGTATWVEVRCRTAWLVTAAAVETPERTVQGAGAGMVGTILGVARRVPFMGEPVEPAGMVDHLRGALAVEARVDLRPDTALRIFLAGPGEPVGTPQTERGEMAVRVGLLTTMVLGRLWVDRAVPEARAQREAGADPGVLGRPVSREPGGRTGQLVALGAPEVLAWSPVDEADLGVLRSMRGQAMPLAVPGLPGVPEPKEVRVGPVGMQARRRAMLWVVPAETAVPWEGLRGQEAWQPRQVAALRPRELAESVHRQQPSGRIRSPKECRWAKRFPHPPLERPECLVRTATGGPGFCLPGRQGN